MIPHHILNFHVHIGLFLGPLLCSTWSFVLITTDSYILISGTILSCFVSFFLRTFIVSYIFPYTFYVQTLYISRKSLAEILLSMY